MPKQLKVIIDANYNRNAPTTVNFSAPIIVEPGNKIALDKFTAIINGVSTNFSLPESIFTLYYALNAPNFQSSDVTLAPKNYTNINELMIDLTEGCNNAFTAYRVGYEPLTAPPTTDRDLGLKMTCSAVTNVSTATSNTFEIKYATSQFQNIIMDQSNMTAGIGSFFSPTGPGDWSMSQSNLDTLLLKGGGCLVRFQFNMPTALQAIANGSNFDIGVIGSDGFYHGVAQNALGEVFLVNGVTETQVDINNFPVSVIGANQYFCEIYQVAGQFALRYYLQNFDGTQTEVYNSNTSNPGALGNINYTLSYNFQADGTGSAVTSAKPGINSIVSMTPDADTTGTTQRTVAIDMSNAGPLRAGLDVPPGLNLLSPQNSPAGVFLCQSSINMSIINSSFDIALEILDLPLQTYQASSDRKPGQRNNVISYFHPELSAIGTSTYIYDSRAYQWLDIDISYPINLSSLSFRIYDPQTGLGLDALSMTFNLLIGTSEY
jgi:hypothetical protein